MALLIVDAAAAAAIQEQMIRRPFLLRISEEESVSQAFFNFWCCLERWFGLNRTGHPDWVKMFGDSNGQIKLPTKQKYKVLSATGPFLSSVLHTNIVWRACYSPFLKCIQPNALGWELFFFNVLTFRSLEDNRVWNQWLPFNVRDVSDIFGGIFQCLQYINLVSLFNDISTLVSYLMPKPSL